jgi:hypothetical protein
MLYRRRTRMPRKEEWTASFPEDDPVYQFFLLCDRLAKEHKREKALKASKLGQVETEEATSPVMEGDQFKFKVMDFHDGQRVQPRQEIGHFSSGTVVGEPYQNSKDGRLCMNVLLDVTPPVEFNEGKNPTGVLCEWFEAEEATVPAASKARKPRVKKNVPLAE